LAANPIEDGSYGSRHDKTHDIKYEKVGAKNPEQCSVEIRDKRAIRIPDIEIKPLARIDRIRHIHFPAAIDGERSPSPPSPEAQNAEQHAKSAYIYPLLAEVNNTFGHIRSG